MSRINNNILEATLKYFREKNGYTQNQVADYLHISRPCYTYYELGGRIPDIYILDQLSRLYCIPIEEFLYPKAFISHLNMYEAPQNQLIELSLSKFEIRLIQKLRALKQRDQKEISAYIDFKHSTVNNQK